MKRWLECAIFLCVCHVAVFPQTHMNIYANFLTYKFEYVFRSVFIPFHFEHRIYAQCAVQVFPKT